VSVDINTREGRAQCRQCRAVCESRDIAELLKFSAAHHGCKQSPPLVLALPNGRTATLHTTRRIDLGSRSIAEAVAAEDEKVFAANPKVRWFIRSFVPGETENPPADVVAVKVSREEDGTVRRALLTGEMGGGR
jgi:hypothetical protein